VVSIDGIETLAGTTTELLWSIEELTSISVPFPIYQSTRQNNVIVGNFFTASASNSANNLHNKINNKAA